MPRPAQGPRLRLFGPDDRYGARPRPGFREYVWYIQFRENGKPKERTTGLDHRASPEELERALADFIAGQQRARQLVAGPRHPDQIAVSEVLDLYGTLHAPYTTDPARIGYAIEALDRWWKDARVSAVTKETCARYVRDRKAEIDATRADRRRQVEARYRAKGKAPPPAKPAKEASDGTPRRELGTLAAALAWCHDNGHLVDAPAVVLPDKPEARERFLSRPEAARLIRAARRLQRSCAYLPLFILIGLYTGARKEAICSLQWQPNTAGGYVDLERGIIDFRKLGQRTNKRRSAIPIPPRLRRFLTAARRRTKQYALEFRSAPVGDPKKAFSEAARLAGIPEVHPHVLRHTAVTWLLDNRVPTWKVAGWVGMSEATIRNVYGHHIADRFDDVIQALA